MQVMAVGLVSSVADFEGAGIPGGDMGAAGGVDGGTTTGRTVPHTLKPEAPTLPSLVNVILSLGNMMTLVGPDVPLYWYRYVLLKLPLTSRKSWFRCKSNSVAVR